MAKSGFQSRTKPGFRLEVKSRIQPGTTSIGHFGTTFLNLSGVIYMLTKLEMQRDPVRYQIKDQVEELVWDQVDGHVWRQGRDQVWVQVRHQIHRLLRRGLI